VLARSWSTGEDPDASDATHAERQLVNFLQRNPDMLARMKKISLSLSGNRDRNSPCEECGGWLIDEIGTRTPQLTAGQRIIAYTGLYVSIPKRKTAADALHTLSRLQKYFTLVGPSQPAAPQAATGATYIRRRKAGIPGPS